MSDFVKNISLKNLHTFHIDVSANFYASFKDISEFKILLQTLPDKNLPLLILGGGSNILFTKNFPGIILQNKIKGIKCIEDTNDFVLIEAGAGENWHEFVQYSLQQGWYGCENLSLIPGTVGASPIQNIGAYGVEVKDLIHSVRVIELENLSEHTISNSECAFGYRNSKFKTIWKSKYVITSVVFKLNKKILINTSYGAIQEVLNSKNINNPTPIDISEAVISIRKSKLPNPDEIGNAGSFFKNPEIENTHYQNLKNQYSDIPGYNAETPNHTKVAAGWLIEKCGWKGYRELDAGVHPKQALVLVNYSNAQGELLKQLSERIKESVYTTFQIQLETEVNIL